MAFGAETGRSRACFADRTACVGRRRLGTPAWDRCFRWCWRSVRRLVRVAECRWAVEAVTAPLVCERITATGLFHVSSARSLACVTCETLVGRSSTSVGFGTRDWACWMKAPARATLAAARVKRSAFRFCLRRSEALACAGSSTRAGLAAVTPAVALGMRPPRAFDAVAETSRSCLSRRTAGGASRRTSPR